MLTHDHPACPVHGAAVTGIRWGTDRREDVLRLRGRANQERRQRLFARRPLCASCEAQGLVTVATIADHVIALADGGSDTFDNLQPLCRECSDAKTQAESMRGKGRAR